MYMKKPSNNRQKLNVSSAYMIFRLHYICIDIRRRIVKRTVRVASKTTLVKSKYKIFQSERNHLSWKSNNFIGSNNLKAVNEKSYSYFTKTQHTILHYQRNDYSQRYSSTKRIMPLNCYTSTRKYVPCVSKCLIY